MSIKINKLEIENVKRVKAVKNERMKELRDQLHLSQEYVANYLGISRTTFNQMEMGTVK